MFNILRRPLKLRTKLGLSLKMGSFNKNSMKLISEKNSEDAVGSFFTEHEQYIANFYRKHKDNFLINDSNEAEFEAFLLQIEAMMSHEKKKRASRNKYIAELKKMCLNGREPLRDALILYQIRLTEEGYDPEVTAETLLTVGKLNQSRENLHRVYTDYTHWDFINSYRMYQLVDDLKYGLCFDNSFMTLGQVAKSVNGLRLSGYKSNEVAQLVCERVKSVLLKKPMNKKFERFTDTPGAGKYGFFAVNPTAGDAYNQDIFRKNIQKLMQLDLNNSEENALGEGHNEKNKTNEVEDFSETVREIIHLLKEQKEVQHNLTDSIDSLLDQYYKIEQTLISNPELKEQKSVKYELFKLQDKLVEGGYLSISALKSVSNALVSDESLEKLKYDNMVAVMKNFSLTHFPDLYNEGEKNLDNLLEEGNKFEEIPLKDSIFRMTDLELGKTLTALSDYTKVTNLDMKGDDYLNEKIVKEYASKTESKHVAFKTEYTKLYQTVETFLKEIEYLVSEKVETCEDVEALGYIYYSYASMNICSELNNKIIKKLEKLCLELPAKGSSPIIISDEGIKHLLTGLGIGGLRSDKLGKIVSKVANSSNYEETNSIESIIGLLYGLSSFKQYSSDAFINLLIKLSERSDYLSDYITNLKDLDKNLYFLSVLLKYECNVTIPNDLSMLLDYHMNLKDFTLSKLQLARAHKEIPTVMNELLIDPVKDLLIKGMEEGLFSKDLTKRYSDAVTSMTSLNLPFFPDRVFGFYGHKVALFLFGKDFTLNDLSVNNGVNGHCEVIRRILKEKFNTYAVFIPTEALVKFDLKTVHMQSLYNEKGFTHFLDNIIFSQLGLNNQSNKITAIDKYLNSMINKIANDPRAELVFHSQKKLNDFLNSLLKVLDLHEEISSAYHSKLLSNKIDKITFELERSLTITASMSENFRNFLDTVVEEITGAEINYQIFCDNLSKNYKSFAQEKEKEINSDMILNNSWTGKRLHVDILSNNGKFVKNSTVELINNNYMWSGEYCPYSDWEKEIKANYDYFNYFVRNGETKHLFNSHKFGSRRVPSGVFPHPSRRRLIKSPLVQNGITAKSEYEEELKTYIEQNKVLINQEVQKNKSLSTIPTDLSLKVNLLNINNTLKQNLEDSAILNYISNFEFIDALISEHLNGSNEKQGDFLSRDAQEVRNYYSRMTKVQEYDEYDKFVMREYYNNEKIYEIDSSKGHEFNLKNIEERMEQKVVQNEDVDSISIFNPNKEDYHFDIKSILSSIKLNCEDEDLNTNADPSEILFNKRRQAERNIILFKIVKSLTGDKNLTQNETNYLKHIIEEIKSAKSTNINKIGLRSRVTSMKFSDLSSNDVYSLNTLYNVEINQNYNNFSLSELVLNFSLFIDNNTINKLILNLFENHVLKLKYKTATAVFNYDNKEPGLISNELKESLWRLSGFLDEEDKVKLKDMLRVKRNKSMFDKVWLKIDEASLDDFLDEANLHENKFNHLEKWIKRKEKEVENRIELPPDNLALSDTQINNLIEKKDKVYRKKLLRQVFKKEDLSLITREEATKFLDELLSTIYSFYFNYPQEIKDIFNALEDLPVLLEEDRQAIKTYRLIFNIDERNPFEFLAVEPVKMEDEKFLPGKKSVATLLDTDMKSRISSSSIPFIPKISEKIRESLNIKH